MPIYAYRCTVCGHAKDVLQKMSDPLLSTCPACGAEAFTKQVTAAGFQLKGSGWYVTDFRSNGSAAAPKPSEGGQAEGASAPDAKGETKSEAKSEPKSEAKSDAASPAPPPAPSSATPSP